MKTIILASLLFLFVGCSASKNTSFLTEENVQYTFHVYWISDSADSTASFISFTMPQRVVVGDSALYVFFYDTTGKLILLNSGQVAFNWTTSDKFEQQQER